MLIGVLAVLCVAGAAIADTPANCLFEDIRGTWTFYETERSGDNTLSCDTMGPVVYVKNFTLDFPNTVMDELGHQGTWTLVWNQGFEVNINQRSYFAWSYYEGNFISATSYCDRTFTGWSRDATVRNWSCFFGNKTTEVPPRETKKMSIPSAMLHQTYKNDHQMIERINGKQSSWRAKAYPEHEKYTVEEMMQRMGGPGSVLTNPPRPAPATSEQRARVSLLPENFDWRDVNGVNYVAPVRDQASCGSCYTFASLAQIESRVRIATQNVRQDVFSTQDVVSCTPLAQGCAGGFSFLIAGRYAQDQGVVAEECNPYTGKDDACVTDSTCSRTYVSDYEYLGGYYGACNEELMLQALVENGPLAVAYAVYDDFGNYEGGIYHHTGERNEFNPFEYVNHAVLLVGYGVDEATGEKYWGVKKSWGDAWGEAG
uniref:Dipeptidyl peptidase 1 n=1 Tax=Eriocheir sinensis TaxID=95602 RepID=E3TGS3_ERISI|nr:cathepsin C [Eriocheir sinensis]ADO65981.1 cathepsin C [Eriocheir sinensis]